MVPHRSSAAMKEDPPSTIGRSAPFKVGLAVAVASAVALGFLSFVLVFTIVRLSREDPSGRPPRRRGGGPWQERVIDLGQAIPLIVVLGVLSSVFVSLIAWWATRKANEPIERALQIQKAFVADASHELRTPLTTLTSRIQLAQRRQDRGGDVAAALGDMREDARVMDEVLTDLLTAAESAATTPTHVRAEVQECVAAAFRVTGPQAETAGVTLESAVEEGLTVEADQAAVTRALVTLIDNALQHAPQSSRVLVRAAAVRVRFQESVAIRVSDQGRGIRVSDPERLFERFARADSGKTRRGFGLGLALVRDIAERFGGSVEVEDTSAAGTTFLLVLPR